MTSDELTILPFADSHAAPVVELWREVFEGGPPWSEPHEVIRRKQAVQPELFLVGEVHGRVVATVIAGFDGVRGWVHHLAVTPGSRRRGHGARMMAAAEERLLAAGCPKLNLQVRAANPGAVAFYTRLGYRVEERVSLGKPLGRWAED